MAQKTVQLDIKVTGQDQVQDVSKALKESSVNAEALANNALKLTKGIAGGFELAAQAASAFGEENQEAFEKSIKRATEYIAQANALKDVAEAFSSVSVKGLKDTFTGFLQAGRGAKLFGIALTSTGVGAIVVGLGIAVAAIAANWEEVVKWVEDFVNSIPFLKSIVDTVSELGGVLNIVQATFAGIVGLFKEGTSFSEEFNKSIAEGKAVNALEDQEKALKDVNEERERSIKVLEAEGKKEEEVFAIKKKIQQDSINLLNERKRITGELSKEEQKQLADAITALKVLEAQERNFQQNKRDEAAKTAKALADQRNKDIAEQAKEAEDFTNKRLAAEKKLLDDIELLRIQNIDDELERRKRLIENNLRLAKEAVEKEVNESFVSRENANLKIKLLEEKAAKETADIRNKFVQENFDLLNKNLDEFTKSLSQLPKDALKVTDNDVLQTTIDLFEKLKNEIDKVPALDFGIEESSLQAKIDFLKGIIKTAKTTIVETVNINEDKVVDEFFTTQISNLDRLRLKYKGTYKGIFSDFEENFLIEFRDSLSENKELFDDIAEYAQVVAQGVGSIFSAINSFRQAEIAQINADLEVVRAKFQEADTAYDEAVNNRLDLENQLATATGARREELLNSLQEERDAEKKAAAEKQKYAKQQEELAKRAAEIQYKINMFEWVNAKVQAVANAAQAVIKALTVTPPASFAFAAITAALASVQAGIVLATPAPPKPTFAEGGHTGKGVGAPDATGERPVGIVHENEWVAPKWMVNDSKYGGIINQLESARRNGFAEGGFTTTPVLADTDVNTGADSLIAALQGLNLQVAVTEINEVSSRVSVIESKSSL
jgi:hypothetical protein